MSNVSTKSRIRIAIIGAGPVGLHAALAAQHRGFDISVFDRGTVADNLKRWKHVRLFSPFGMNSTSLGRERVCSTGQDLPEENVLLTGNAYRELYLKPLAALPEIEACLHQQTRVISIGRERQLKGDAIGADARASTPFRVLIKTDNHEAVEHFDYVLDCSGTFGNQNWIGNGGMPCPGEEACGDVIDYNLPDVFGIDDEQFFGKAVLVVGGGYSAATSVVALNRLSERVQNTPQRLKQIYWMTRKPGNQPLELIPDDALEERNRLAVTANETATSSSSHVRWMPGHVVERLERTRRGRIVVTFSGDEAEKMNAEEPNGGEGPNDDENKTENPNTLTVDRIIANVGYRPDRSIYEELQVHECYASQGPMKLAAQLLGESSADCLDQQCEGVGTLQNPEPGFFILGAKSYGRNSRFLMKVGFEQVDAVIDQLASEIHDACPENESVVQETP